MYGEDRGFSDEFLDDIRQIVGPIMLEPSSWEVDVYNAADLVVIDRRNLTIGCRVRRIEYLEKYENEFTLRYARSSGAKTEFEKVIAGWCDWFFYGFGEKGTGKIVRWRLIDLHALREHFIRHKSLLTYETIENHDGTTSFMAFDLTSFPEHPRLIIAQGGDLALIEVPTEGDENNGEVLL